MALPIKTTDEDLEILAKYLDNRVGFVPLAQLRGTVDARHGDNRKIEAMRFIGLLERKDDDVKLTDEGHAFARSTGEKREQIIAGRLKAIPLYAQTLEWLHFTKQVEVTKTQLAQFWHDKQAGKLEGAAGAALTDAVIFFMRVVGISGLGKFVAAGSGRDTHLEMDSQALAIFATNAAPVAATEAPAPATDGRAASSTSTAPQLGATAAHVATVSSGVNINIEVHVAGDAKADTVREIFRNMRRYVLGLPDIEDPKKS